MRQECLVLVSSEVRMQTIYYYDHCNGYLCTNIGVAGSRANCVRGCLSNRCGGGGANSGDLEQKKECRGEISDQSIRQGNYRNHGGAVDPTQANHLICEETNGMMHVGIGTIYLCLLLFID